MSLLPILFLLVLVVPAQGASVPGGDEFLEGRRLQQTGKWAASIEQFRIAAEVYTLVPDYALYQMAQSAFQEGDMDLGTSALGKLLNLYPDSPIRRTALLELANIYYETGEAARTTSLIEVALPGAESPREIVGLMLMLAKAHTALSDFSKSDSICWQIIHGWPSTSEALEAAELVREVDTPPRKLAVAKVYFLNKKTGKALEILESLIAEPDAAALMPELLLYKAQSLERRKPREAAVDIYDKIIWDHPESSAAATALSKRADYKRAIGALVGALADYAQVVELFPKSELAPQALWKRAKIFEKSDDPDEYREYERILKNYPRYRLAFSAMMYWGVKLYQAGDYVGARGVFEKLLAANLGGEAKADAGFWIAKCVVAQGNTNSARIQLAGVIKRFEDSYQAFRARSILKTLTQAETLYSRQITEGGPDLVAFNKIPYVSSEADTPEKAYEALEGQLSYWSRQALDRLKFLMLNQLSEAEWELAHISRDVRGDNARYALGWALFQAQVYNDAIKVASSLRGRITEDSRSTRVRYLLYPLAYTDLVSATSSKYDIDPMLTLAVMREESHFREDAISVSNARGLMQIIPSTGEWLAGKLYGPATFDRTLLFRPSVNIELGNYYLRYLLNKFDNNIVLVIAAYNWGETSLRRWMGDSPAGDLDVFVESIPVEETRRYVKKVLRSYAVYHSLYPPEVLAGSGS